MHRMGEERIHSRMMKNFPLRNPSDWRPMGGVVPDRDSNPNPGETLSKADGFRSAVFITRGETHQ
jgi:hypothetical protein